MRAPVGIHLKWRSLANIITIVVALNVLMPARADWNLLGSKAYTADAAQELSLAFYNHEPYLAVRTSYWGEVNVVRYTAGSWQSVGDSDFIPGSAAYISLAVHDGVPYLGFCDLGNGRKASVMYCPAGTWQYLGSSAFSPETAYSVSMAIHENGEPYVAFQKSDTSDKTNVMRYTAGSWQSVGASDFSPSTAAFNVIAFYAGEPYVAFYDNSTYKANLMRYTSGSWQSVGPVDFTTNGIGWPTLGFWAGDPCLAFKDQGESDKATMMRYTSGNWEVVGQAGFTNSAAKYIKLAIADDVPYIVYSDGDNGNKTHVMRYLDSSWQDVGSLMGVGNTERTQIGYDNGKVYVAYSDAIDGSVSVYVWYDVPTVATQSVTNITSATAQSGGSVTDDGGAAVTERGICWSATSPPTTADNKVAAGTGMGSYTADLTGLAPDTTYYVRAYAINSESVSYGAEENFLTTTTPTVTTTAASSITSTSATCGGNVTDDGRMTVTQRGVCWSPNTAPTTSDHVVKSGTGTGSYQVDITDLTPNTTYYFRAYAINNAGTSYGSEKTLTTAANPPVVKTLAYENVTTTSAEINGEVTSNGGAAVTERGVCYATTSPPTTSDSTIASGSGAGGFSVSLSELSPSTTYYARAYATNSADTSYGETVSFTTLEAAETEPKLPLLSVSIRVANEAETDGDATGDESVDPNLGSGAIGVGDEIGVVVMVRNSGTAVATNVTTRIPIPAGLQFIAAYRISDIAAQAAPIAATVEDNTVVLQLGNVGMNGAIDVMLQFAAMTAGEMLFEASIGSDEVTNAITAQADEGVEVDDIYYVVNTPETPLVTPCSFLGFTSLLALVGLVGISRRTAR